MFCSFGLLLWWITGSIVPAALLATLFGLVAVGKYALSSPPQNVVAAFLGKDVRKVGEERLLSADGTRQFRTTCHCHSHFEVLKNGRVLENHLAGVGSREGIGAKTQVSEEVLAWVDVSNARRTMMSKHTIESVPIPRSSRLQLVQSCEKTVIYLIHCDERGGRITDTCHESICDAFEQAVSEYEIYDADWHVTAQGWGIFNCSSDRKSVGVAQGVRDIFALGRLEEEITSLNSTLVQTQRELFQAERMRRIGPIIGLSFGLFSIVVFAIIGPKGAVLFSVAITIVLPVIWKYSDMCCDDSSDLRAKIERIEEQIVAVQSEIVKEKSLYPG